MSVVEERRRILADAQRLVRAGMAAGMVAPARPEGALGVEAVDPVRNVKRQWKMGRTPPRQPYLQNALAKALL